MNKILSLGTLALLGTLLAANEASADSWSSIASGCVLETPSAARAQVSAVFGSVAFAGSSLGVIRLSCPITVSTVQANTMLVSYYDPDGAAGTCQIRAYLQRTGLFSEAGGTSAAFASTGPATGRSWGTAPITAGFDFYQSYYWVDVELIRNNTSCNPTFMGVHLYDAIP